MRCPRRSPLWPLLLAFLLAGAAEAPRVDWAPDVSDPAASPLVEQTWMPAESGCAVRLRRLTAAERLAYLERIVGARIDPFAVPPDRPEHYLTFRLEIENGTAGQLMLHPERFLLKTNREEILTPLGLETLQAAYGLVGNDLPSIYARAKVAVLEGSYVLHPGQTLDGLLVYRAPHPKSRSFAIDVAVALPDGQTRLAARYRRVKEP